MKRFETEKLKQRLKVQVEEEVKENLRRALTAEIEKEVEVRVRAEVEKEYKEREIEKEKEKERERLERTKQEEEQKMKGQEEGHTGVQRTPEEEAERQAREAALVQALKASLSQDVFNLVYAELSATESLPPIEEPVITDLRNRITRRLAEEMNIKGGGGDNNNDTSPSLTVPREEDLKRRGRSLSQQLKGTDEQPDSNRVPSTPVTLKSSSLTRGRSGRVGRSGSGGTTSSPLQQPGHDVSMAIFAKIANMENYLVSPRQSIERKYRRASVTPGLLRRMVVDEEHTGVAAGVVGGGDISSPGGVGKAEAALFLEKEKEREAKFSTLPPRFSEERGRFLQELRESLKEEEQGEGASASTDSESVTSPVVAGVDAMMSPSSDSEGVILPQQGTQEGQKKGEGEPARGELREEGEGEFVEDLLSEHMMALRQEARISLAAARRNSTDGQGVQERGEEGGGSARGSGRLGSVAWIRKNSPAVGRRSNSSYSGEEEGDLSERERLVAELQDNSRDSIPVQLKELALGLEGIDMSALSLSG